MKLKLILFLSALFLSTTASATCSSGACYGVGAAAVVKVLAMTDGNIMLHAPPEASNLNCTLHIGTYMMIHADNPSKKEIYAMLLTGIALGKYLFVRIIEGTPDCEVRYVRMDS